MVAGASATIAASFLLYGEVALRPSSVAAGATWGSVIFAFDRALVKWNLNPVRLPDEAIDAKPELAKGYFE